GAYAIVSRRDLMPWLSPAKRRLLSMACQAADRVLTNADAIAAQIRDESSVRLDKVRVVHNGIDIADFDRQARRSLTAALPGDETIGRFRAAVIGSMHMSDKG